MKMKHTLLALSLLPLTVFSASLDVVDVHSVAGKNAGQSLGVIKFEDSRDGLIVIPDLHGFAPNSCHGFHIHQRPSCENGAADAGDHLGAGPGKKHEGPNGDKQGHIGDMVRLCANEKGDIVNQVIASHRLTVKKLIGHSLVIHEGADDYGQNPGGARIACGVITKKDLVK